MSEKIYHDLTDYQVWYQVLWSDHDDSPSYCSSLGQAVKELEDVRKINRKAFVRVSMVNLETDNEVVIGELFKEV